MQLMIDLKDETHHTLLLAAEFLRQHAALLPPQNQHFEEPRAATPAPGINGPSHKIELVPDVTVPAGTSNVLPFIVPPAPGAAPATSILHAPAMASFVPPAPTTTQINVSPVTTTVPPPPPFVPPASVPAAPPVGAPAAGSSSAPPAAPGSVDVDTAGLQWDARIHQEGRSKKKDGTWMLKRRIDPALVEAVTKELIAAKGAVTAPAPAATGAAPPPPPPPSAPAQDPNAVFALTPGSVPPAAAAVALPPALSLPGSVPPLAPAPGVPVPPAPASASIPPVSNGVPPPPAASPLRDFVMKCARLVSSGIITKEQQDAAIQQAGAPSMQHLGSAQHLIPAADYYVSKAAGLVA